MAGSVITRPRELSQWPYSLYGGSNLKAIIHYCVHPKRPNRWAAQTHKRQWVYYPSGGVVHTITPVQQQQAAITVSHPGIKAQFSHQQAQKKGGRGCSHLFLQHRAPGEAHKVLLEGPALKRGGEFPWWIMTVRDKLNVFTGWIYLIPEYRSDIV